MSQGSRPHRVADQIRSELALLITREVHDPGLGFVTLTRVQMSPDLQQARVYYTVLGDEKACRESGRALERAAPFLRRRVGAHLHLRRVPELTFVYDESVAGQDRIERLLHEIQAHATPAALAGEHEPGAEDPDVKHGEAPSAEPPPETTARDDHDQ